MKTKGRWLAIAQISSCVFVLSVVSSFAAGNSGNLQAKRTATEHQVIDTDQSIRPQTYRSLDYIPVEPDYTVPAANGGLAPVISQIPTAQNVVFLTIDDGGYKAPFELSLLLKHKLKASLFLADSFMQGESDFFLDYQAAGYPIENHSIDHELMSGMTYEQQKQQICGQADKQAKQFGRRPTLFRPPGGDFDTVTQQAAADCGMKAIVMWSAKANGGSMQYQVGDGLQAGDIVLMHFRPEFAADLQAFITSYHEAGLYPVLLEDWL